MSETTAFDRKLFWGSFAALSNFNREFACNQKVYVEIWQMLNRYKYSIIAHILSQHLKLQNNLVVFVGVGGHTGDDDVGRVLPGQRLREDAQRV